MSTERWPLRARFAHWAVAMLAPWLDRAPPDAEAADEEHERQRARDESIFLSGLERGYEEAYRDAERRRLAND